MSKANKVLDRYYLETRCALVETAATLDRIDRAGPAQDPRLERLRKAVALLAAESPDPDRAERMLMLFTD